MKTRPGRTRPAPRPAALAALALIVLAPAARAQSTVQVPPIAEPPRAVAVESDSTAAWAARARAAFRSNPGDSAGGENYRPYEAVGLIARRLLRALPHRDLLQAHGIQSALDSLGFVTEIATDPGSPTFALLMVRNPARYTADAVGFLFWYKGEDLRIQGAVFKGGYHPRIRVWRTGKTEYPYEWGVLDETRAGMLRLTLLRLSPAGSVWGIQQDEESAPLLGEAGEAAWLDLNQDGYPEFATWTHGATDSLFTECPDCPRLLTERIYVEDPEGFQLQDERLLPTPYATLVYFVRLLIDGKLVQAEKLVRDPARVREAVAEGWNQRVIRKPWFVEYGESGETWPRRLALRFQGPHGVKRYGVIFAKSEGRWIIENWFEPQGVSRHYPSVTIPPAGTTPPAPKGTGTRPPAPKPSAPKR